jgi:hypothetical protein
MRAGSAAQLRCRASRKTLIRQRPGSIALIGDARVFFDQPIEMKQLNKWKEVEPSS